MRQPMRPRNAAERKQLANIVFLQNQARKRRKSSGEPVEVILAAPTNLQVEIIEE